MGLGAALRRLRQNLREPLRAARKGQGARLGARPRGGRRLRIGKQPLAGGLRALHGAQAAFRHEVLDRMARRRRAAAPGRRARALPRGAARGRGAVHLHSVSLLPAVERAQELHQRSRHPHHRRHPHLCGDGLLRRVERAGEIPARRAKRTRRGLRRAAGLLQRRRSALGQPTLRLRGHAEGRL